MKVIANMVKTLTGAGIDSFGVRKEMKADRQRFNWSQG
jgi:hypothetical protein